MSRIVEKYGSRFEPYQVKIRLMPSRRARFSSPATPRQPIWQLPAWPAFTWDEQVVQTALLRAQEAQARLAQALHSIGFDGVQAINGDLWSQEALATAAIEGQSLDVQAVRSSVGHRLGLSVPAGKDRDVEGLVQVMQEATEQHAKPLNDQRLCAWQKLLFPGNEDKPAKLRIAVGSYRTHEDPMQIISGPMGKEVVHYTAPSSAQVPQHMTQLLYWLQATRPGAAQSKAISRPPSLVRAALSHVWFEAIHPFEDGNGRVGRALADHVIAQELKTTQRIFSLSRQIQAERKDYYLQLNAATLAAPTDAKGIDVTAWVLWFIGVFTRGCEHSLSVIRLASDKATFWQRCAQIDLNTRQRKVLARLLEAGDGGFLGGLSAEKYMKITDASKATATRDLAHLYQSGLLAAQGLGKATRYAVAVRGWHVDFVKTPIA